MLRSGYTNRSDEISLTSPPRGPPGFLWGKATHGCQGHLALPPQGSPTPGPSRQQRNEKHQLFPIQSSSVQENSQPQRSPYFPSHLPSLYQEGTSVHISSCTRSVPRTTSQAGLSFCSFSLAQFEAKTSVSSSVPIPCHRPKQNHSAISLKTAQVAERLLSKTAPGNSSCHATSHAVSRICNLIQIPIISTLHLT